MKTLLDRDADLEVIGYWHDVGGTALEIAKQRGCPEIVSMIKEEYNRRKAVSATTKQDSNKTSPPSPPQSTSSFEARTGLVVCKTVDIDVQEEEEEEEEDVTTPNSGADLEFDTMEHSSEASTVSSANTASQASMSQHNNSSSNSLMQEITKAIKAKKQEIEQELRRAEEVDAEVASLEAQIRTLRAPGGDYRSEEQKCDLVDELDALDGKTERVQEAMRLTGETVTTTDEDSAEVFRCSNCLREPVGQIHECVKCEGMLCSVCLVTESDKCSLCHADLRKAPLRRHRLAERKVRKRRTQDGAEI